MARARRRCCASTGSARALLTAERTALNFLGRLSGVATKTARVVRAVAGDGGRADPRHPQDDARAAALEKAAVAHGGGVNHRVGLFDAILIKENHAALGRRRGRGGAAGARGAARTCRWRSRCATRARSTRRSRPARRGCCSTT